MLDTAFFKRAKHMQNHVFLAMRTRDFRICIQLTPAGDAQTRITGFLRFCIPEAYSKIQSAAILSTLHKIYYHGFKRDL